MLFPIFSRIFPSNIYETSVKVVVTYDFNGEYGHGFHILTANATAQALENAADNACRADSEIFVTYGVWDTPKAYFHLYGENIVRLDLRVPLESMRGQTALEVAKAACKKHVSQQMYSFHVSDDYEHRCAEFGLYRTNVGNDTGNSMLENIVLYSEQEGLERGTGTSGEGGEDQNRIPLSDLLYNLSDFGNS